jgi:hypothetical protein
VFYEKSLEVAENKERRPQKESKERTRVRKLLKRRGLRLGLLDWEDAARGVTPPHPRAIQMVIKTKGLREKQFVRL